MTSTKEAKTNLERAQVNEEKAAVELRETAIRYAEVTKRNVTPDPGELATAWLALIAAAKKHTNAAHQTSRRKKHLRQARELAATKSLPSAGNMRHFGSDRGLA